MPSHWLTSQPVRRKFSQAEQDLFLELLMVRYFTPGERRRCMYRRGAVEYSARNDSLEVLICPRSWCCSAEHGGWPSCSSMFCSSASASRFLPYPRCCWLAPSVWGGDGG